jgi:2-oxoglutarate ferredoxin oxidoreductase subunit alpha
MSTQSEETAGLAHVEALERVVIRFAGDSGDGMQITGSQFTSSTALAGNDLATFPDYPAEIRAPAGTLPGVSGFQINFSSVDIMTPGDSPDVLVAMNPAALKVNLPDLKPNASIVVNSGAFDEKNLVKARYESNPLEDGSLDGYRVYSVDLTKLTRETLKGSGLSSKEVDRCKNFFALGMMFWLYNRSMEPTERWLREKFRRRPELAEANIEVMKAGYNYCDIARIFQDTYEVAPARLSPGLYRNISGNQALALGLLAASVRSARPLFLGSYPITPASDVLHQLSRYKNFGVVTFQAEDEIAAIGSTLGAAFGGSLAVTTTSGPGLDLKSETLGLAIMAELPLVLVDVQRGGPSTGLPTKTEQADLLHALFGRHGEAPVPVLAACTASDCFDAALEACRVALAHTTPVILLTDGSLANGAEPWKIPELEEMPDLAALVPEPAPEATISDRDPETLARPWILPGTAGKEHRIGGLEQDHDGGGVSYDPRNHERMIHMRAEKVARVARHIPEAVLNEGEPGDDLLVVGWGGTYGAITQAVRQLRGRGRKVASLHLRWLNPMPSNLEGLLARFERILVPEMNLGQLAFLLRGRYRVETIGFTKTQGLPFKVSELVEKAESLLGEA